ncbi:MAG: ABC transporter ATP-binding protein [Gammaproteobacteria bacterium]|nr:ABC transporter ATP-binding protein [Gammaproteobacteria bacterium]
MSLLDIQQLSVEIRQGRRVENLLRDINLHVSAAEVVGLIGESGAGKSMITRAILDLLPASAHITSGDILFENAPLLIGGARRNNHFIGREISFVPQDPLESLNPVRRIGLQMTDLIRHSLRVRMTDARDRAHALLEEVSIRDAERVMQAYPHELSGGMRQRVLIAMAFSVEPKLIIADEPTTALDVTVQKTVLALLQKLQKKYNTSVLFITHDLGIVAKLCNRVTVLFDGYIVETTTLSDSMKPSAHPYTRALYDATLRYDQPDKPVRPIHNDIIQALREELEQRA